MRIHQDTLLSKLFGAEAIGENGRIFMLRPGGAAGENRKSESGS